MNYKIEIIELEEKCSLEIETQASMLTMPKAIAKAYADIFRYMKDKNACYESAPYVKYVGFTWEEFNINPIKMFFKMMTYKWSLRIGIPTTEKIEGTGDIRSAVVSAGRYIKTLHIGPYQQVGRAYKQMTKYAQTKGLAVKDMSMEMYLNDPRETNKQDLKTELYIPLK